MNELKIRVSKLEKLIESSSDSYIDSKETKLSSPIKSITFREGSNDDRIRIYWEDGR